MRYLLLLLLLFPFSLYGNNLAPISHVSCRKINHSDPVFRDTNQIFSGVCEKWGVEEGIVSLEEEIRGVRTETENGRFSGSFTSGGSEKKGGFQLFWSTLYWHAKVGGAEYIYHLVTRKNKKVETQSFDWDWGYKVGAGLFIPILKWEVIGTYMHFGTQGHEGRGNIPPSLLISLKEGILNSSQKSFSNYKIDYDNVELNFHRSSFLSRLLGLETSFGLKKIFIDQKQGLTYQGRTTIRIKDRYLFASIGPSIGLNMKWDLLYGISLIADTKGSLLYGNFEVKHSENEITLKGSSYLFTPTLHFLIGLRLKWRQLYLSLAYEAEYFWRQNQSVKIENSGVNTCRIQLIRYGEDLTFYGITLKAGIEF